MNAFTRMFYVPNSKPPTLSLARVSAIPLIGFGIIWLAIWTVAATMGKELPLPWWAGLATICAGATLYAANKFSAGPVSVELSGPVENVTVNPPKKDQDA